MSWLEKQLKFRDLKRIIGQIREASDDDGILDDLEAFVRTQLVEILVTEITSDPMYQALIKALVTRLQDEL